MARICEKCGVEEIPYRVWIDGKRRNLQGRKFCLKCSPFGSHNTKDLTQNRERVCKLCGRAVPDNCGYQCHSCWQKKKERERSGRVYGVVGEKCWKCGYGENETTRPMLDFHHVDPKKKCFNLDLRAMSNLAWKRVEEEMRKCVLLCCRCHREERYGLISKKIINEIYRQKWNLDPPSKKTEKKN